MPEDHVKRRVNLAIHPLKTTHRVLDRYTPLPSIGRFAMCRIEECDTSMTLAGEHTGMDRTEFEPQADATHRTLSRPLDGPGKREVDLYVRTYTTLLESSGAIGVASLESAHVTAAPSLHAGA